VAVHGITANHAAWGWLADLLGEECTLLAPDLRGRGASGSLGGPFGMAAHADDLGALLDHSGVEQAVVVGHSMGGYVAAVMAAAYPDRVSGVVLVDGGLGRAIDPGADPDAMLAAVLGPALERLEMTFPSESAYFDFWRGHPVFSRPEMWDDRTERYFRWDLVGSEPELRSGVDRDGVLADGRDLLVNREVLGAPASITAPTVLLRAERGLLDQPEPLLPDDLVEEYRAGMNRLDDRLIAGTNHYSIVMGAAVLSVARVIAEMEAAR
jgi:pimeloyl-ACP methyl ester carboxylesterase